MQNLLNNIKTPVNKDTLTEIKANTTGYGILIENDGYVFANKDMMNQIKEDIANHKEFVIPDNFIMEAVFQKYGIKNANGRIYPENVLKAAVQTYIDNYVNVGKALGGLWSNKYASMGSLDHPSSSSLSLHDVSHKILELHWVNSTLVGKLQLHLSPGFKRYGILSTTGDMAANLLMDNFLIGVSSRALGSVSEKYGTYIVNDDLQLVCWDIVAEPSTPQAYIGDTPESLEQFIENNQGNEGKPRIDESLENIKKILL